MGLSGDSSMPDPESLPKGLIIWREAVSRAHTAAQLAMSLYMLESSIAWDKSIMKAVSDNLFMSMADSNQSSLLSLLITTSVSIKGVSTLVDGIIICGKFFLWNIVIK